MNQRNWRIVAEENAAIQFAAEEFIRLMGKLDPEATASVCDGTAFSEEQVLFVGVYDRQVQDPVIDDAVSINVRNCAGHI